ncbi:hypothetical protein KC19_3G027600 [Ceratodon purpureus]|uniref:Uncharacterized protein n=1 Tax=Ceratodon purpureus TaxID=3225 RepID=A0A8T0IGL7_CERPU|nr:hypothetical protein KC19_3G027600 [Ceratodon purpureus]
MEEEGETGSRRESVGVSGGEGAYENATMGDDGGSSREDSVFREDSFFERQGAIGGELTKPEGSVSQEPLESRDANLEISPILTPEKLKPEFVNSREISDPNNEAKYSDENFLDHETTPYDTVNRQESIECRSFLEGDDYSESALPDNVSEMSTSVKNYSTVDDEGVTPQFEDKKEIVSKESEDVVMEIAERLSQLRSIGKTAESARKYILESDTSTEDLESNDHMSDLLGPKRLDFEVIDFDQFGAQPPDLPLNDNLKKVHHHGGISSFNGGKGVGTSTKAKKPEHHLRALDSRNGIEQEMKGLHDHPVKIGLKNTPEKKHPRKEREASRGHDVSRDFDTSSVGSRTGSSKLRLPDSLKPKKLSEAPMSGSPIRRSKSTMPDVKGSPVHEETRKRTEDLQHLTHMQAKRLEEYCNRVDLSTAQLKEQSRMHEELNRRLETECGERLKSEAELMMLREMLPNVEEKLKDLCDQMLFMEVQLQEQVDFRNKLEEALERERQERVHLVANLEEQIYLRNKLEGDLELERQERMHLAEKLEEQIYCRNKLEGSLELERQERMHFVAKIEEQVDLSNKLEGSLERELQERINFVAKLEEQVDLRNKLEESLERERQERLHFVARLEEQVVLRNKLEEDLEQERQDRLQLAAKLDEQVDFRNKLEENLDQERQERTQYVLQLEQQTRLREELANKLDRERDERLTSEAGLMVIRELLPNMETKLVDLNNQVESLISQLQEQTQSREVFNEKLDQECKDRMQHMAKIEAQMKMHEESAQKFDAGRDERNKNETTLKELRERLPKGEEQLLSLQNQVLSLATQLQEQIEMRKELEQKLDLEREERTQNALIMANYTTPASSIPWSEEKIEFTKLLHEQKELLANQVKEAATLKTATEKKVGLLNHQVQNLEMRSEVVETMECVTSAKDRAMRQTMWTVFQAVCLGIGLMSFILSCSNSLPSYLQPT